MLDTQFEWTSDELTFSPVTQSDAAAMLDWQYERPYDIYNMPSTDPDERAAAMAYLLDLRHYFHRISSPDGEFVAFCSFGRDAQVPGGNYDEQALDIGLGVRPELTGQGVGSTVITAVLKFAHKRFQPYRYRVTIAAFNRRAQRVWERQGFQPVQTFVAEGRERPFIIFTRPNST